MINRDGTNLGEEIKELFTFVKRNKLTCYILFFFALIAYGLPLTNYSLSIDEEIALLLGNDYNWNSQGRYGIDLLKAIFHFWNSNSITSSFLAVILLSLSSIIWIFGFQRMNFQTGKFYISGLLMSIIFITFPAHSESIGFSLMSFELGIGWVCVASATNMISKWAILKNRKNGNLIWGLFFSLLATSIYQGFLPVLLLGLIVHLLLYLLKPNNLSDKLSWRDYLSIIFRFALVCIITFVIYKIIDEIVQIFTPSSGYIESYVLWGKKPPKYIISGLLHYFGKLFTGKSIYGVELILPCLIISVLITLYYIGKLLIKKSDGITKFIIVKG